MASFQLRSETVLLDDEDVPLVEPYRWLLAPNHSTTYVRSLYLRSTPDQRLRPLVYMHRLITGARPGLQVDHTNGNGLDNRKINLRVCSPSQNGQNQRARRGAVPYKGVWWNHGKWEAGLTKDRKSHYLGRFIDPIDAAKAYDAAALKLFGDFANLNFPSDRSVEG